MAQNKAERAAREAKESSGSTQEAVPPQAAVVAAPKKDYDTCRLQVVQQSSLLFTTIITILYLVHSDTTVWRQDTGTCVQLLRHTD